MSAAHRPAGHRILNPQVVQHVRMKSEFVCPLRQIGSATFFASAEGSPSGDPMSIAFSAATSVLSENVPPALASPYMYRVARKNGVDLLCSAPVLRQKQELGSAHLRNDFLEGLSATHSASRAR